MNHQPLVADTLKEIGREDTRFDRLVVLTAGEMFGADDPPQVPCDLHLHIRQLEFHGEGIVEDQHPGIAHRRPVAAEAPPGMNAGDVFEMRPHFVHLEHVQAFKGGIKGEIGAGDFFDTLFDHGSLLQRCGILLQTPSPARASFKL